MNMIHLVTDSTAYLPPDLKAQCGIRTISLNISCGDQTFAEDGGITQEEFVDLVASVDTAPTTSQPSVGEFMELYQELTRDGDEVISIYISEKLSGTVPNARSAAREVAPERISVVDSRSTSVGLLIMVLSACEALAAGKDRAQVLSMLERMVQECEIIFSVETLEYLHKGGRISGASRFLGTVLSIKPILYLEDGKIEALDKVRTTRRARQRILDEIVQRMAGRRVHAGVTHLLAPEAAEELAAAARERLNCASMHVSELGPVIGSHVGPGLLGIAACPVSEEGY
jgi:DegV family protein with EDD domain